MYIHTQNAYRVNVRTHTLTMKLQNIRQHTKQGRTDYSVAIYIYVHTYVKCVPRKRTHTHFDHEITNYKNYTKQDHIKYRITTYKHENIQKQETEHLEIIDSITIYHKSNTKPNAKYPYCLCRIDGSYIRI